MRPGLYRRFLEENQEEEEVDRDLDSGGLMMWKMFLRKLSVKQWTMIALDKVERASTIKEATAQLEGPLCRRKKFLRCSFSSVQTLLT
jgi:hypothetical protein